MTPSLASHKIQTEPLPESVTLPENKQRISDERSHLVRPRGRHRNADHLRAGTAQPVVRPRFRRFLRYGIHLRISSRRLALRPCGSSVVGGGGAPLVAGARPEKVVVSVSVACLFSHNFNRKRSGRRSTAKSEPQGLKPPS